MTPPSMRVRKARLTDAPRMVEIMEANRHYYNPDTDGTEALECMMSLPHNVIMVSETDGTVTGFITGTWNGARAFIFKLSVHPDFRRQGIGLALVRDSAKRFREMGAVNLGVCAADGTGGEPNNSVGFWQAAGFELIPARLMIHFDIGELAGEKK